MDARKVDLCYGDASPLPYNFQCKTTAASVNYLKLLQEMPKGEKNIILSRRTVKSKTGKFMAKGDFAIMSMETLLELLENQRDEL